MRNLHVHIITVLFVGLMFALHRQHVNETGQLPGMIKTFEPSSPPDPPIILPGEGWHCRPVTPTNRNLWVYGPLGPDGQIVPRGYYTAPINTIENYTAEDGTVKWRMRQ